MSNEVVLRVENNVTYIDGRMEREVYQGLKKCLGYMPEESFWMTEKFKAKFQDKDGNFKPGEEWRKEWDGSITTLCWNSNSCKCNTKKKGTHFPSGLLSKAKSHFSDNNIKFTIVDNRIKSNRDQELSLSDEFQKRDYQEEAIQKIVDSDRGMVKMATGSGKTVVSSGVIVARGVYPTIFYVPSIDLAVQAKNEIEKFVRQNGSNIEVGQIGGGKKDIKDINVMTIQTAVRVMGGVWKKFDEYDKLEDDTNIDDFKSDVKDLIQSAKLMICDEVQHWASETCQIISDSSVSAQYRYGFSATPWRDKGDDILIDACFGKCLVDINASFLIRNGYLVKPTIYMIPMEVPASVKKNKKTYPDIYKYGVVENSYRNGWIADSAKSFYDNGNNILILVRQINHGKLLEDLIPGSYFIHGSHSSKKRKTHLDKMREGGPLVTISSVIFDEGIDCKCLDTLLLAGSGKSPTRALQRIGRVLRPFKGKTSATVVDFRDSCKFLKDHSKEREKMYRSEPEFDIKTVI